jgi:hypothetical protein
MVAVPIPTLEAVLPDVAGAALYTKSNLTFTASMTVDNTFKSTVEVTNAWAELLGDTTADDRYFLADGTSLYASEHGRLHVAVPEDSDMPLTHVAPRIGAWPLQPDASRLSLYVDGVEYPGTFAPPPLTSALLIRQPLSARGDADYLIEATFTAPALQRPTLYFSIDIGQLPGSVSGCSVSGLPLELDSHPSRAPRVHIPVEWSQLPSEGAVPLPLPHVTLRCVLRLAGEEAVFAAGSPQFSISVHDGLRLIGRGEASMRGLSAAAMVVRVTLSLSHKLLGDDQLDALLRAVAGVAADRIGLSAEQVSVHGQEAAPGDTTLVTFEVASRGNSTVTVTDVKAIASDIVSAARSLGYTVADGAEQSVSGRLIDAACSYTCGAGCRLCEDDASCAWDLDCRGGACRNGVCHTPAAAPTDLTILWIAIVAVVAAAAGYALYRFLQEKIRQGAQAALLTDMDDLEGV